MIFRKLRYWWELKRHQYLPAETLRGIQTTRLTAIIKHAYRTVPFYRKLFDSHGVKPDDVTTKDHLQRLPVITRKDVQEHYPEDITARDVKPENCFVAATSGSTGIPLKVCLGKRSADYSHALSYYAFTEHGIGPFRSFADLKVIVPGKFPGGLFNLMLNLVMKEVSIQEPLETTVQQLGRIKPFALYGYPSYLRQLALHIRESQSGDETVNRIKPGVALVHGETLTPGNREIISSVFGADVFSLYGSAEFPRVAFECEQHNGLHVITDGFVVEFLDDAGNPVPGGESGHIIITCLFNYEMPLIRYAIGDVGRAATSDCRRCSCGRNWPLMAGIEGRADDYISLPSGRVVSPRAINLIEDIRGIKQYRTVQETKGSFMVLVVVNKDYSEAAAGEIKEVIKRGCLGEKVQVIVKVVDEIPRDKSGKSRAVISKTGPA